MDSYPRGDGSYKIGRGGSMRLEPRLTTWLNWRRSSGQNIMVTIPGPLLLDGRPDQEELVLNDLVQVGLKYAREVLDSKWGQDWALRYTLTVHSSQGLSIADPKKVWIIDDYLQWSNLAYLALSRVEYLSQLERVVCPQEGLTGLTGV